MTPNDPAVLLDVNLLLALAWPNHVHHARALSWWRDREREKRPWATCPHTQFGFVRVSSNRRVFADAKSPGEATALLSRILGLPGHVFWPDDVSILDPELLDFRRIVGHRQVSDAQLVALAIRHRGRIASFDRGLTDVVPEGTDGTQLIELLVDR